MLLIRLACLLAALSALPAAAEPLHVTLRPLSDTDLHRAEVGAVTVLGVIQLESPGTRWFGGLSGLSFNGEWVLAVNDSGHWVRFRLDADSEGRPLGARDLTVNVLGGLDGTKDDGDAEELVALPDGWLVAFERRHRLRFYRDLSDRGSPMAGPDLSALPANGGVEAAERLADGRLVLIAEETGRAWIGGPGGWHPLAYAATEDFKPTAAAALPDGDLLVLERRFSWLSGVAVRLVRVPASALATGRVIAGRELMRLGPPLLVDNYEGLAVRRRGDGRVVAYLISDDNFSPLQATLLMAVLLP
jgi:hypothetical protein